MTRAQTLAAQEAAIAADRAELAATVAVLRARLTPDDPLLATALAQAAPVSRAALEQVKAHPLAAVLVAVGLGWLVLGRSKPRAALRQRSLRRRLARALSGRAPDGRGTRMVDDHPLILGAAALVLGAAVGAVMPQREDSTELGDPATGDAQREERIHALLLAAEAAIALTRGLRSPPAAAPEPDPPPPAA